MKQMIPAAIAIVVLGVGMAYHLKLTGTGEGDETLTAFTKAVQENIPTSFGDWTAEETPLTAEEFKLTNCTGYVSRLYKNKTTGDEISVYVVTGTARHITIHTPDWCYRGAGFAMMGNKQSFDLPLGDAENDTVKFTTASFRKEDEKGINQLRIFWTYSDSGKWEAPGDPKMYYAWHGAMYKVYLIAPEPKEADDLSETPNIAFAREFMPVLNKSLFNAAVPPVADSNTTASTSG